VTIETGQILKITPDGIEMEDGTKYTDIDAIVCATGFDTSFRPAFPVVGEKDDLREVWKDEPKSYLSISATGFPNFFCEYHCSLHTQFAATSANKAYLNSCNWSQLPTRKWYIRTLSRTYHILRLRSSNEGAKRRNQIHITQVRSCRRLSRVQGLLDERSGLDKWLSVMV
jgi:hypothetical protein